MRRPGPGPGPGQPLASNARRSRSISSRHVELAPGDTHHAPARDEKRPVPLAVALEARARAVRRVPVELHDDATGRPGEVDLDPTIGERRHRVDARPGKTVLGQERGELGFEDAADHDIVIEEPVILQDCSQAGHPGASPVQVEKRPQLVDVEAALHLGLLDGAAQPGRREGRGEIEKRP